ncbi:putative MATH domain containing protein [Leishmania utingensis]|uniref:MATH domain containing protein n=1 Tax=Leishmania utingensis TaxID=653362 RepID=A0AAW3A652_9TRYP
MHRLSSLSEGDLCFYQSTLYQLIQDAPVEAKPGREMLRTLRKELIRSMEQKEFPEYCAALADLYKTVADTLISAAHRSAPHELINRTTSDCRVVTDEDEYQFHQEEGFFDDDDDEMDSSSDLKSTAKDAEQKQRKREETKRKRREEEDMLMKERKVTDEKGKQYHTLGPFPPPRLTVRTSTNTFPSRKALQQRTIIETPSSTSSSSDEDEAVSQLISSRSTEGGEAVNHLTDFLQPLSIDSLKKVGESAKAKLRPSSTHDEFVSQIVKTAVRLGCEKACVLMEKQKIIEDMTSHVQTGPLPTAASIDFLNTLPDHLKQSLGSVLGLPEEKPPVEDMWERMVAMGFLSVLTNLRLKPLKKIANELSIVLPDTNSTEKFCEFIVFAAFPRERIRAKFSRAKQKKVRFTVPPDSMSIKGDMGFVTFHVNNISMLTKESERHYSPEFHFANLKWSLLCMTNKESLALYLCQTGSVHCKFLITVVNKANSDDSICNEGTQSFSAMSQENDWGFNNVIKFAELLNPDQGFVTADDDSITIEVGIVLVEPLKTPTSREKAPVPKEKKNEPRVDEAAMLQLLADEKVEQTRKKLKQEISKTIREEEKTRKDITQRATKAYHDLFDRLRQETKRTQKEVADRERKEEQERQRELDKIKYAQEQAAELKSRLQSLKKENAELAQSKQDTTQAAKEAKMASERIAQELKFVLDRVQSTQQKLKAQEMKLAAAKSRYESVLAEEPDTPSPSDDENDLMSEDLTRFISLMTDDM